MADRKSTVENMVNPSFWEGKRVFITGHTGFKGAWLSQWLNLMGAEVTGFALSPPSNPNLFDLTNLASRMHSVIADINDVAVLKEAVDHAKPDVIFHLAAQSLVRYSYQHPIETYQTNVMGTVNILEAMRASDTAKVLVNITTDKCYENKEWQWGYREIDALGGYDPYSSSKGCSELITAAYRQSFFNPNQFSVHGKAIASARAGNVVGGGDWAQDRLVPDIISTLIQNKSPVIRFPHAIRPWQHVLEPLSGYLLLAEKLWNNPTEYVGAWNFGPEDQDCQPVSSIADQLCLKWGHGANWILSSDAHPHEASFLKLDISKAKSLLHWQPRWRLSQTLEHTVDWYRSWNQGEDPAQLTTRQIKNYMNQSERQYA